MSPHHTTPLSDRSRAFLPPVPVAAISLLSKPSRKLVLAVDFDGTIVEDAWPHVGRLREGAADALRLLKLHGHTIILWTCRTGTPLEEALAFLRAEEVPFHYVNENCPQLIEKYGTDPRKIGADLYIDDKAVGGVGHWDDMLTDILFHAHAQA